MDYFDTVSKRIPVIGFLSLIISAIYNAGFLSASSSIDLLSTLSYQDIIISSLYIFPILITLIFSLNSIYKMILYVEYVDSWWKYIILFLIFLLGLFIFYMQNFRPDSWAWTLVIFSVSPFIYKIASKFQDNLSREHMGFLTIFIVICLVTYSNGYASYRYRQCVGLTYVSTKNCENCLLLKVYSGVLILKKVGTNSVFIEKNENDYEIRVDEDAALEAIQTPYCNPIKAWLESA